MLTAGPMGPIVLPSASVTGLPLANSLAHRAIRHPEGREAVRSKVTTWSAFEGESEAVGFPVADPKAADREFAEVDDRVIRQRNELQLNGGPSLAPQAREHSDHNIEGTRAGMNRHEIGVLVQSQGRQESRDSEHVIEVAMCQQEPVEPSKADTATKQLALSPLPTIYQDTIAARLHKQAWMVTFSRWNAR